jgi:hypothetical protein
MYSVWHKHSAHTKTTIGKQPKQEKQPNPNPTV